MPDTVTPAELLRLALLYAHLLAFAAAVVGIAFGDHALFARSRIRPELFRSATRVVTAALLALWLTGMALVALDTQGALLAVLERPKLLAKLSVVLALSANGWLIHRLALPALRPDAADGLGQALRQAALPCLLGGFSAASWAVAAFIGIARPVAGLLGYGGFMALYALALAVALPTAWCLVRPRLAARLLRRRAGEQPATEAGALGLALR